MNCLKVGGACALVVGLFLLDGYVPAQCAPGADGFDTGCCAPVAPVLPALAQTGYYGVYGMIDGCGNVLFQSSVCIVISAPVYTPLCDYAVFNVLMLSPLFTCNGTLLGKYARVWRELSPTGMPGQVWRFLLNGDLLLNLSASAAGLVPPIAEPPYSQAVHFTGFIDFECNAGSSPTGALCLSHWPGVLQHSPFSTNAVAPLSSGTTTYHIVAPGNFTYAPTTTAEPQGPVIGDSSRHSSLVWSPFVYNCFGDTPVATGSLTTSSNNCLLPLGPGAGPFRHQVLNTIDCCGSPSPIGSVPLSGTPIPTGLVALPLGAWTGGVFPYNRSLTVYFGVALSNNPCSSPPTVLRVVTGAATTGSFGFTFPPLNWPSCFNPVAGPVSTFLDLQGMLPISYFPVTLSGFGSLFASDWVLSLTL